MHNRIRHRWGWQELYGICNAIKAQFTGSDADSTHRYPVTALLPIERIVHVLMQNLPFNGETVILPLLIDMYQSPLSGTEPEVLNPRQHEHIVFAVHIGCLYQLLYSHVRRDVFFVNRDSIIAE